MHQLITFSALMGGLQGLLALRFMRSRWIARVTWLCAIFSMLLTAGYLLADQFTGEGINESVLFHVMHAIDAEVLLNFPAQLAAGSLSLLCLAALCWWGWCRAGNVTRTHRRPLVLLEGTLLIVLGLFSVGEHPAAAQMRELLSDSETGAPSVKDFLERAVPVDQLPAIPGKPRSLVYIYAESLESLFLNSSVFPGLTPELNALRKSSFSLSGLKQAPMTDWTIAGMVASQCGYPLAVFRANPNDLGDKDKFVPGLTCLGDLLAHAGYTTVYMGGADLQFAGKGHFYQSHGFKEVNGLQELQARLPTPAPTSKWGIHDDTLLPLAVERYRKLASSDTPFLLTVLTLDTHPPSGFISPSCDKAGYPANPAPILQAVHCADRQLAKFIQTLESIPTSQEVIIVLASDHLQMRDDISPQLEAHQSERTDLFLARGVPEQKIHRAGTTMDIAPTVLSLMGWNVPALGFGRSLLQAEPTLTEELGDATFFAALRSHRYDMWSMWEPEQ